MQSQQAAVELKSVMAAAEDDRSFRTFVKAVKTAGLDKILSGDTMITVFAPTEKAFSRLPRKKKEALFRHEEQLAEILLYHVVPGKLILSDVLQMGTLRTVEGDVLTVVPCDGIRVNNAEIIKADIDCVNGMIHGIDMVLFPK